jgi:hypothetical protein
VDDEEHGELLRLKNAGFSWSTYTSHQVCKTSHPFVLKVMSSTSKGDMASFTARRKAVKARGLSSIQYQLPHGGLLAGSADTISRRDFRPAKSIGRVIRDSSSPAIAFQSRFRLLMASTKASFVGVGFGG